MVQEDAELDHCGLRNLFEELSAPYSQTKGHQHVRALKESSGPSTNDMGTETHGRDSEENQRALGRGSGEEYVFYIPS